MNRAALAAALVVAGGGLFWSARRAVAAAMPASSAGSALANAPLSIDVLTEDAMAELQSQPWLTSGRAQPYLAAIASAEAAHGIPQHMLARLLWQESRFRDDIITGAVKSSAGALGIAQFMPATAAEMGIDPLNPWQAIDGAARYLRRLYDALGRDWAKALAAYNWGIGNVQRRGLDAAPAETRAYYASILEDVGLA